MGLIDALQVLVIVCWLIISKVDCICSTVYGAKPCPFVPAPPGETPSCANPGLTYCEFPHHYPRELVKHLVEKWKYDHSTLLLDETTYELDKFYVASDDKYGIHSYGPPQNNVHNEYSPDVPISTNSFHGYPSNAYIPPRNNTFTQYRSNNPNNYKKPTNQIPYSQNTYNRYLPPQYYNTVGTPEVTTQYQNGWNKWNSRKYYMRRRRSLNNSIIRSQTSSNFTQTVSRSKRQSSSGQPLCQSRTGYLMPKAALNSKGDWKYLVNLPEVDNRYTQLVKSETCVSQQCNGLCSLPNGYSSRCEQKYVQKRLVALEGGGNQLYTDVFWFPSCCVCTINNN